MSQVADPPSATTSRRQRGWLRDVIEVLLIAFVLYAAIWTCLQTVRVEGQSMIATLQDQDFLLASKISYHLHNPERGDIIVLIPPNQPTGSAPRDFIKRVIGLPGDVIEISGNQTPPVILVKPGGQGSWQRVAEPYLPEPWVQNTNCCTSDGRAGGTPAPLTIPSGQYFVMGDNRNFSSDSRVFGLVPRANIVAKAFLRIWPFNHFGGLGVGPTLLPALLLLPPIPGRWPVDLSFRARPTRNSPRPPARRP